MVDRLLTWARRNTRRAVALAIAPGLAMLAVDAAIGHFMGNDFDNVLQFIPVVYGGIGFVVLIAVVWPKARAPFAWSARILGAVGVIVGLTGTTLHLFEFYESLEGEYSWAAVEGGLSVSPPLFAPLAFCGVGVLLFLLPSARLLIRFRVGRKNALPEAGRSISVEQPPHQRVG